MFRLVCCAIASLGLGGITARAASTIDAGTHNLLPNQDGQLITIAIEGDDEVRGFNLRAQIGDGTGPGLEPRFSSVSFSGGIWDAHPTTVLGGPVDGATQFAQASVNFSDSGPTVSTDGLLVTLAIDTRGISVGDFPLLLANSEIAEDSDLIVIGGGTLAPSIRNGTLRVVPEPHVAGTGYLAAIFLAAAFVGAMPSAGPHARRRVAALV